jgi:hypothetical protein
MMGKFFLKGSLPRRGFIDLYFISHVNYSNKIKIPPRTGSQWLTPVIPATHEAEIRRIMVQSQPREIIRETLSRKNSSQKRGWWSEAKCRP